MNISEKLNSDILSILEIARYAPSVHNTQPWKVHIQNDNIIIDIDPKYHLRDGDPTGRQTIISLGIFAEAIVLAASAFGFRAHSLSFKNTSANIKMEYTKQVSDTKKLIEALKHRTTDRSIYEPITLSSSNKEAILKAATGTKAKVWIITEESYIQKIAFLTSKGISVALSSPDFRRELSQYLVEPWSKKARGISVNSLYIPKLLALCEPLLIRIGIGLKAEAKLEYKRWLSASAVILITSPGDMPEYWFEAGRAYLHTSLKLELLGLSQATSAATVEASNYHEDVESLLGTPQRLQSVIRVGKGRKHRNRSPRVPAEVFLH